MEDVHYRFELTLSQRFILGVMAAGMMLAVVPTLNSENVNLPTYYPAPSGVYTRMITTGDTLLARDAGGLSVGTAAAPINATRMTVMGANGNVGIGTTDAASALSVAGGVQMGDDVGLCLPGKAGTQRWHNGTIEVCDGGGWKAIAINVYSCPEVWLTPGCDECTNSCVGQLQLSQTCTVVGAFGTPIAFPPCVLAGRITGS